MTPKTLFNILLKIMGIFFIKDILISISQLLSFIPSMTSSDSKWMFVSVVTSLIFYGLISFFFIAKSELLITWLRLDKGFDQESISLNIHRSTILSISIIVLGGIILVEEIPKLCQQAITYLQIKRTSHGTIDPSISYTVIAGLKVIFGIILIVYQRYFVNIIELRRKK